MSNASRYGATVALHFIDIIATICVTRACVDDPIAGSMYIFPRIKLPAAAVAEAKARGLAPDLFYAMELLDATGVVVVPVCARICAAK